ncbi:MAG: hypothetical protein ACK48W_06910 [Bacteroidota bacterium]
MVATDRIMIARYNAAQIFTPASFPRIKTNIELLIKQEFEFGFTIYLVKVNEFWQY